jgi:uncharacterized repeat protein (TIGR03803 family)
MRLAAVVVILALGPVPLPAQSPANLVVLHTFTSIKGDGASPAAGLVLSGNTLYGTTSAGGVTGYGTVFQVNTDGSGFSTLYTFTNGTDGATPKGPLLLAGGMLYGTASAGGYSSNGTVFSFNIGGSNFSTLYTFTNGMDGSRLAAGLVLSGNTLYGTTEGTLSGSSYGTVFMLNTDGSGFTLIHRFSAPSGNTDGYQPAGPLFLSGGTLYGAATDGGANGTGTLFTNNGSSFGHIYTFPSGYFGGPNSGGANPQGGVVVAGSTLYGAAYSGGSNGLGMIYKIGQSGSGFSQLYAFPDGEGNYDPQGPLTLSGNMIYGATTYTIFGLTTNGTGYTNLYSFPFTGNNGSGVYTNATGSAPNGGLVLAGGSFYGTAQDGGANGFGTVFALNLLPAAIPLTIQETPGNVVLTWTNAAFALQSAPGPSGPFTNILNATSPYTNAITGSQMYFRLLAN